MADDSGADAQGVEALVGRLAASPRLDVMSDGAGTGTGPSYHQMLGVGLLGVRAGSLDLRIDQGRHYMW